MKTFCKTFLLPNGVFIFYIDGRQFILCYDKKKIKIFCMHLQEKM